MNGPESSRCHWSLIELGLVNCSGSTHYHRIQRRNRGSRSYCTRCYHLWQLNTVTNYCHGPNRDGRRDSTCDCTNHSPNYVLEHYNFICRSSEDTAIYDTFRYNYHQSSVSRNRVWLVSSPGKWKKSLNSPCTSSLNCTRGSHVQRIETSQFFQYTNFIYWKILVSHRGDPSLGPMTHPETQHTSIFQWKFHRPTAGSGRTWSFEHTPLPFTSGVSVSSERRTPRSI